MPRFRAFTRLSCLFLETCTPGAGTKSLWLLMAYTRDEPFIEMDVRGNHMVTKPQLAVQGSARTREHRHWERQRAVGIERGQAQI